MLAVITYHLETIAEVSLVLRVEDLGRIMIEWSSLVLRTMSKTYVTGGYVGSSLWRTCVGNISKIDDGV